MPIGIDRQLKPIPDAELRVDRRQVVAHGGFADAQTISNRLVLEPLADHLDELTLTRRERPDLDLFWVGGVVSHGRVISRQHTGQQKAIGPDLAGMNFGDGVEENLGGFFLAHQAHGAQANGAAVHVHVTNAGEHDDMCFWRGYMQLWQQIQAIAPSQIEVEQDDVRMLKEGHRERILRAGALAHHDDAGLTFQEHP